MKLKFLLFALLISAGVLQAQQDTIKGLMITEAFMGTQVGAVFEITNLGDEAVDLGVIEWGEIRPWGSSEPFTPDASRRFMLPSVLLEPGKSFVLSSAYDFEPKQFAKGIERHREKATRDELWTLADMLIHLEELNSIPGEDSVFWPGDEMFGDISGGRSCFFIRQHINETDSVVLDQVGGVFDGDNNLNAAYPYDVAGVTDATTNSYLMRKFKYKNGNLDFNNARGVGEDDSEWIVVPITDAYNGGVWRDVFWTLGNHGDYKLDENTLESDIIDVDFANKTLTVPWGIRRGDGVMREMVKKPGVAWTYIVSPVYADSLSFAAATGDQIEIIVCGDERYDAIFDIIVADPTADANIVLPVSNEDPTGGWRDDNMAGKLGWPRVTTKGTNDSIWGERGGLPYATRVDSLLERLGKAPKAEWEMVWVDNTERPDLMDGDKLKVTADDGSTKEYFIAVRGIRKNTNADLLAITWPDIPEFYKGIFGWVGDTIPSFGSSVFNYRVKVPSDVDGIPGLVGKTNNSNAKIEVDRAKNLTGTLEDRTISFVVTAEDDTTTREYFVELVKEKNPLNLQPYYAEPFLSEYVFQERWSNHYAEVVNPGNQPLDLSNYMICMQYIANPADQITGQMEPDRESWLDRFNKYIPGYKWVSEQQWAVTPGIAVQDLNVNPIVMPGDVFTMGKITTDGSSQVSWSDWRWTTYDRLDVVFGDYTGQFGTYNDKWDEEVNGMPLGGWSNQNWFMFKILNDSIKLGLKPANDPNDFELIESFGMADGSEWVIGGFSPTQDVNQIVNFSRKPEYSKGNIEIEGSFGTDTENTEWTWTHQNYWAANGVGWPFYWYYISNDIGQHFMNTPTEYMSTVSSVVYKISPGFKVEEIKGLVTGSTAADLLANVIKPNENQVLKVTTADGSELAMDAVLSLNDTLTVLSADSTNTTKYVLQVSEGGLSSNALLTSGKYTIDIQSDPKSAGADDNAGAGTVAGFEYGTSLKTVIANIDVPAGASMDIIDGNGAYVPLVQLNFDTAYVNVTVNSNTYLDVTAENGVTKIVYQLLPQTSDDAAFITSTVYSVSQKDVLIQYVPRGTNVQTLLGNLVPNAGATVKLVNNMGQDRVDGGIADDDKVVVTSKDGETTTVYLMAMLAERYVPEITYLAYITSKAYDVDQLVNKVNNVSGTETIADFYSKITPSMGATAVVVDKDGTEKTSGDIDGSDMVKVTSADGKITVMYAFGTPTSTEVFESNNIELYPNPTNGVLNISGVEQGNRIQIYNATGAAIRDINVQSNLESVSLQGEPSGMYLIVISNESQLLGRYKAIKK